MNNTETSAAPRNTEEQLVRPVDRLARHLYDALKSIEAARKALEEARLLSKALRGAEYIRSG
jgi:hypothetical protein